jgi:hypothetical protein
MLLKNVYRSVFFLFLPICAPSYAHSAPNDEQLSYYLYIQDFIDSFIEIPTSNVSGASSTIASQYLAGRAPIYQGLNEKVGTFSASFLSIQNQDGIFTDISNYLSGDNGLVISWFTPAKPINLELDTMVHSMVSESIVAASTKIDSNPFFGETFDMVVSSDNNKIFFNLSNISVPPPDLVVTSLHAQKLSSGKFLCSFKVANNGTETAVASKATITRSKTRNPAAGQGMLIKTFNIPALAAGAVSARFQARTNQGTAKFCVVDLDTASVVPETNEVNNRQAKKIL